MYICVGYWGRSLATYGRGNISTIILHLHVHHRSTVNTTELNILLQLLALWPLTWPHVDPIWDPCIGNNMLHISKKRATLMEHAWRTISVLNHAFLLTLWADSAYWNFDGYALTLNTSLYIMLWLSWQWMLINWLILCFWIYATHWFLAQVNVTEMWGLSVVYVPLLNWYAVDSQLWM